MKEPFSEFDFGGTNCQDEEEFVIAYLLTCPINQLLEGFPIKVIRAWSNYRQMLEKRLSNLSKQQEAVTEVYGTGKKGDKPIDPGNARKAFKRDLRVIRKNLPELLERLIAYYGGQIYALQVDHESAAVSVEDVVQVTSCPMRWAPRVLEYLESHGCLENRNGCLRFRKNAGLRVSDTSLGRELISKLVRRICDRAMPSLSSTEPGLSFFLGRDLGISSQIPSIKAKLDPPEGSAIMMIYRLFDELEKKSEILEGWDKSKPTVRCLTWFARKFQNQTIDEHLAYVTSTPGHPLHFARIMTWYISPSLKAEVLTVVKRAEEILSEELKMVSAGESKVGMKDTSEVSGMLYAAEEKAVPVESALQFLGAGYYQVTCMVKWSPMAQLPSTRKQAKG